MKQKSILHDQTGLVSILVTLFLMLVLTLIVLGFAGIIRREQRQTLDRQLSTQAFYAAETGINDAVDVLKANAGSPPAQTTCANSGQYAALHNSVLDASAGIEYTCLLVDPSPTSLVYDAVGTSSHKSIPINGNSSIDTLSLSWQDTDGGNSFSSCPNPPNLPTVSNWSPTNQCDAGLLRIDLVKTPTTGFSRSSLSSGFSAFLYPHSGSGATNITFASGSGANAGATFAVNCDTTLTYSCNANITGLSGQNYYLRVVSVYKSNKLIVSAKSGGSTVTLSGAQAVVDSTGKGNDVLRRIAVRVNISGNADGVPIGAIESTGTICKRFTANSSDAQYDSSGVPLDIDATPCQP